MSGQAVLQSTVGNDLSQLVNSSNPLEIEIKGVLSFPLLLSRAERFWDNTESITENRQGSSVALLFLILIQSLTQKSGFPLYADLVSTMPLGGFFLLFWTAINKDAGLSIVRAIRNKS